MLFKEYWEHLQRRNKGLSDGSTKMTITVDNFERALKQAYEMGNSGLHPESIFSSADALGDLFR